MGLEIGKWHIFQGQPEKEYFCVGKDHSGFYVLHTKEKGNGALFRAMDHDKYTPIPDSIVRYYNIYSHGTSDAYSTREWADKGAGPGRLGCKKVVFTSGEFDD